ncbi:carbonic anhydrase [Micromonospora sp. NPDC049679]|uniref:carbonic anhydrase n=1 Tax=Micromonospora sp. NPDC049679 TaxID=3155920 RepID=UPI0033F561E7
MSSSRIEITPASLAAPVPPRDIVADRPGRAAGPAEALANLLAGNERFVNRRPRHGHYVAAAEAAASGDQEPSALVMGCIDSRVPLEAIFDQTFGSICVARSGGQVLDRAVLGSVEFAVVELGVPLVVVLGHERCGAVASTVTALRTGERPDGALGYLVDEIAPAVTEVGLDEPDVQALAVRRHVARSVLRLRAEQRLAAAIATGGLDVVGGLYNLDTGRVELLG